MKLSRKNLLGINAPTTAAVASLAWIISGCSAKNSEHTISDINLVQPGIEAPRTIGDEENQFVVTSKKLADDAPKNMTEEEGNSLILGVPFKLLNTKSYFGAVITQVSDRESELLGTLKLTDLPPMHVIPRLAKSPNGQPLFALFGCVSDCTQDNQTDLLITLPISGIDEEKGLIMVDLSAIGAGLDLIGMLDPNGAYTKLKTTKALTTAVDFSESTLVFDVESHMEPIPTPVAAPSPDTATPPTLTVATPAKVTVFTTRWYIKLNAAVDPSFVPRKATNGVGYFETSRGKIEHITRFATNQGMIKYYIKDVPEEFKPAFASAFDSWNELFKQQVGNELLSYEFIDANDARSPLLVPGDVRYNIVAWDLINQASYGGLGPSIANQITGQTFSANVLVQGPTIVDIYSRWFAVSQKAHLLATAGETDQAEKLLAKTQRELTSDVKTAPKLQLKLGDKLNFRVVGQMPAFHDPIVQRAHFEPVPAGETYASYMEGYFHDMITHELGHNLGLRHNFKGTLGGEPTPALGKVSRSIMDYMNRSLRYLDRLGDYDQMAIAYGYAGRVPQSTDWFCTDEHIASAQSPDSSAECSKEDATNDPFAYFEAILARGIDLLTNRGQNTAPNWTVADMETQLKMSLGGMMNYAGSATKTAATWTNFFGLGDRPSSSEGVKAYVVQKINAHLCNPALREVVASKTTELAKAITLANLSELRSKAIEVAKTYEALKTENVASCAL